MTPKKALLIGGIALLSGCAIINGMKYDRTYIRNELKLEGTETAIYCRPKMDYEFFKQLGIKGISDPSDLLYDYRKKELRSLGKDTFKKAVKRLKELSKKCSDDHLTTGKEYNSDNLKIVYEKGYNKLYYNNIYISISPYPALIFINKNQYQKILRNLDEIVKEAANIPEKTKVKAKETKSAPATEKDVLEFFDL